MYTGKIKGTQRESNSPRLHKQDTASVSMVKHITWLSDSMHSGDIGFEFSLNPLWHTAIVSILERKELGLQEVHNLLKIAWLVTGGERGFHAFLCLITVTLVQSPYPILVILY